MALASYSENTLLSYLNASNNDEFEVNA